MSAEFDRRQPDPEIFVFELYNPNAHRLQNLLKFLFLKDPEYIIPVKKEELHSLTRDVRDLYNEVDEALGTMHCVFTSDELQHIYEADIMQRSYLLKSV